MRDEISAAVESRRWPLFLYGPVGTGKTCAAWCVVDEIPGGGYRIVKTVSEISDELMAAQGGNFARAGFSISANEWWDRWNTAAVCVLDELGTRGAVSAAQYENVYRAIDRRKGKPLVVISNLSPDELVTSGAYDDRVMSRAASGTIVEFTGEDRRFAQ